MSSGLRRSIGTLAWAILALAAPRLAPPAAAANLTWDANTGTAGAQDGAGAWDSSTNTWWTGAANTTWSSATPDNALIGNGGTLSAPATITLGANVIAGRITIGATTTSGYTIDPGSGPYGLTLNSGLAVNSGAQATAINAAIALGGSQSWTNNSANALTIGGAVGDGSSGYALAKGGTGTIVLGGANTYGGTTTVGAGTLAVTGSLYFGVPTGLVDLTGGTISFRNDANTVYNANIQAATANGTLNVDRVATGVAGTTLTVGTVSISATRTLTVTGGNSYCAKVGAVANSGSITVTSTTMNGLFITGAYSGSGTITANTGTSSPFNAYAGVSANEGSVHFANGQPSAVVSFRQGDVRSGSLYAEGNQTKVTISSFTPGGSGSSNHVKGLIVRGGASIVIDNLAAWSKSPGGNLIRWILGGDGNVNNKIEFTSKTNLSDWFTNSYVGTTSNQIQVGGLNLIQHADAGGTDFSLSGAGSAFKAPYLTFEGTASNDTGGWTLAEGTLNVKGYSGSPGAVQFNGSRYIDVVGSSVLNLDSQIVTTVAASKTVTKKGTGAMHLAGTVNSAAVNGTIVVAEGTLDVTATPFNTALTVGGAGNTAIAYLNDLSVGGALTVSSKGQIYPSASGATGNRTAANIALNGGANGDFSDAAVLNFNFNGASCDSLSAAGQFAMDTGYFKLNPTIISPVPGGTYTLVSGATFSGTFDAGKWQIAGNPAGWSLQMKGTGLDLVVAGGTSNKWKADTNDGNWNTSGNWTSGTVPNGQGVTAEFDDGTVAASGAVALDVPVTLGTLKFSNASNGYNIGTGSSKLTFQNDANQAPSITVVGTQEISGAQGVEIAAGNTLSTSGAGMLTISGPIRGTGNAAFGSAVTLSSTASDFTGTTLISSGTTTLTGKLTATSTITVNGQLDINTVDALPGYPDVVDNGTINVNESVHVGTLTGSAAVIAVATGKTLTLGRDGASPSTSTMAIGSCHLVKEGNNTITLNNNGNGVFDSVTVNGGTLIDAGIYGTGQPSRPDAIRTTTAVNGAGSLIAVNPGGTFALYPTLNVPNSYHGVTGAGKLRVMAGTAGIGALLGDNSAFTGTYQIDDGVSTSSGSPGNPATISLGSGSVFAYGSTGTATIGTVTQSGASAATFGISGTGDVTVTGTMSGNLAFNQATSGTVTLTTGGSYSGATSVSAGTLLVNGSVTGSAVTVSNTATLGGTGSIGSSVGLNGGSTLAPSSGAFTLSGTVTLGGTVGVRTEDSVTWSYSGAIGQSGTGAIVKRGAGTVVLSGTSAYSGTTTVSAGTLAAGADVSSGAAGPFGNSASAVVLGDADSAANAIALLADGAFTIERGVTVNDFGGGTTIGGANTGGTAAFTGAIALNKAVTLVAGTGGTTEFKTGTWTTNDKDVSVGASGYAGTVKISNALSTAGTVSVNRGTLNMDVTMTAGAVVVGNAATLEGTGTVNGPVTLNDGSAIGSAGTLTLTGDMALGASATAALSGGTVSVGGTAAVNGTLNGPAGALRVAGALTGAGTIAGSVMVQPGGRVEPDGPSATLTVGSLAMGGATLKLTSSGGRCGQVAVPGGAVDLGEGTAKLEIAGASTARRIAVIAGASGVSGQFEGHPEGARVMVGGEAYRITYKGGVSGHDVVLTSSRMSGVIIVR